MTYALIQNNQVVTYPYSIYTFRLANPNISLPADPTEAQLNEQGIYVVYPSNQPTYDPIYENCNEGTPEFNGSQWVQVWVVTPANPSEIEFREAQAKQANKTYGTQLLQETDWAAIASIADPLESNPYLANRSQFLEYRNQVRNIVLNPPVQTPVWPIVPNENWQAS